MKKKKLRLPEVASCVIIVLAIVLIGCRFRSGWVAGAIGSLVRMPVMIADRRWFYVGLDATFIVTDVMMFGAWSGWWPNYIALWLARYVSWLAF